MKEIGTEPDGNPDWVGLMTDALSRGDASSIRLYVKHGADPNAQASSQFYFLRGSTLLRIALLGQKLDMVQTLVEEGADPNALDDYGFDALIAACAQGRSDMAHWALQYCDPARLSKDGRSALSMAAGLIDDSKLITKLMVKGDPRAVDNQGVSALMYAAMGKFELNLRALLPRSDPKALDDENRSAMHYACCVPAMRSKEEVGRCAMLLAPHSDLDVRDKDGNRAEKVAANAGYTALAAELKGMRLSALEAQRIGKVLKKSVSSQKQGPGTRL